MVINHNMSAMFAQRSTGLTEVNHQKNMEKLSSGMKINRAGDDASGLAVSEKMRSQIRGLNQA
ncbi:MAG TPA: flagellin, partial [Treponema sp.]|nr:flagellin [Treponema sp.]